MKTISLTLPYPPMLNNLYFHFKGGRALTARGREYKKEVFYLCLQKNLKPFEDEVFVKLKVYRPRKSGDLDGVFKIVLDALQGLAYNDDKQIGRIAAERFDDKANPRIEIEIGRRKY